jgi:hypothetical protein
MITETQFKEIYSRYQSSGLTIRLFCHNEGMYEARFYYWRKRLQRFLPGAGGFGFIPVKMEERKEELPQAALPSLNPVFNIRSEPSEGNCSFEITYPNGTRLKFSGTADYALIKSFVLLNR